MTQANTMFTISIHAPLAGSDWEAELTHPIDRISIHAPLAGSDFPPSFAFSTAIRISIHAPLAGSDRYTLDILCNVCISIHAPLAGSDSNFSQKTWKSYTKIYLNCILFKNTIHFYFF